MSDNRVLEDSPKFVITSHFERMASGVIGLFTGKPWPPVLCHLVCAAHPPIISNKLLVVSSFASLVR